MPAAHRALVQSFWTMSQQHRKWLTAAELRLQRAAEVFMFISGCDLRTGLQQGMALRGLDRRDQPDAAASWIFNAAFLLLAALLRDLVLLAGGGRLG